MSDGEQVLAWHITVEHLPQPERQYPFLKGRRYRADFAWPEQRLIAEVQGGAWTNGRHTRGAGYEADCERLNLATLAGWRILYFTTDMVTDGRAVATLRKALGVE